MNTLINSFGILLILFVISTFSQDNQTTSNFSTHFSDLSGYEDSYVSYTYDAMEQKAGFIGPNFKADSSYNQWFPSFQLSMKIPFNLLILAHSDSTYIFYTGKFEFHTNRKSGPINSTRNNVGILFRNFLNDANFPFVGYGVAHESDGQTIEDSLTFSQANFGFDHLDMGWNYIFLSIPYMRYSSCFDLAYSMTAEFRLNVFKKNKGPDGANWQNWIPDFDHNLEKYRGTQLKFRLLKNVLNRIPVVIDYEILTGSIFNDGSSYKEDLEWSHHLRVSFPNHYFPFFLGTYWGKHHKISQYWRENEPTLEIGFASLHFEPSFKKLMMQMK